jgi:hypothetical protein
LHALLWNGSAESVIDLHPDGYSESGAQAVFGDTQVGYGNGAGGNNHALLWKGTAESVVDLHPAGFESSLASGISAIGQVGTANGPATGLEPHAFYWNSTADSALDLHTFLPATMRNSSAEDIDANGTIVGYAYDYGGKYHAVLWTLVPEPGSCALVASAVTVMGCARIRRRR